MPDECFEIADWRLRVTLGAGFGEVESLLFFSDCSDSLSRTLATFVWCVRLQILQLQA